jgi:hypothetical protein
LTIKGRTPFESITFQTYEEAKEVPVFYSIGVDGTNDVMRHILLKSALEK